MIDKVKDTIANLKLNYPIAETWVGNKIEFKVEGLQETFHLSVSRHECILFMHAWHEHFDTADALAEFLDALFTGRIQIVVKYRGRTPVAHRVQLLQDGKARVVSRVGSLVSPFWRKKSYKTLDYRAPDHRPKRVS